MCDTFALWGRGEQAFRDALAAGLGCARPDACHACARGKTAQCKATTQAAGQVARAWSIVGGAISMRSSSASPFAPKNSSMPTDTVDGEWYASADTYDPACSTRPRRQLFRIICEFSALHALTCLLPHMFDTIYRGHSEPPHAGQTKNYSIRLDATVTTMLRLGRGPKSKRRLRAQET